MIILKEKLKRNGLDLIQLTRVEVAAIYTVKYKERVIGYEVIKIRCHPPTSIVSDYYEVYPHNEAFGKYGWSFTDLGSAVKKFSELLLERNKIV